MKKPGKYTKLPATIEAIQFDGLNWDEVQKFVGVRVADGHRITCFNILGTYLLVADDIGLQYVAELWVEANHGWLPINLGEWILKDEAGFYPCKDHIFKNSYRPVENV